MSAEQIYRAALEAIAQEDGGFPTYTPQAMVSIAKRAMREADNEPFDLRKSPQYHPGDLA
jgi:hypothetical protein